MLLVTERNILPYKLGKFVWPHVSFLFIQHKVPNGKRFRTALQKVKSGLVAFFVMQIEVFRMKFLIFVACDYNK